MIDQPQATITIDASGQQVVQAHVAHQIDPTSQKQTKLRVINVHYPSSAVKSIKQVAVLKRNLYVDQVTNETVYNTWSTGNFDEYVTPTITGYTASQPLVDSVPVTSATPNVSTIDLYYTKN
ncbi:hypothetical protein MOO45_01120 [Bombilactobacillus folatiphilus]|uniref:Mub B2-like domain-containing protein n=1 Tax=Bombilactobacillus folatiphilus TaxID=2923362 RepID=A0ABY4P9A6_9LACO|nr:hypothetical protein [Bombilactobacillus folatiphilus]UQS82324.1 hypothetical protein MOO45_01120 [Bombilactobacillus folatiphilus]